jgi:hypothetical protein
MTKAERRIPWLPIGDAITAVARYLKCTVAEAEQLIRRKAHRIKSRGTIEGASVSFISDASPAENVELLLIDMVAEGLLPPPAKRARWEAVEAIAYLHKGVPLPWAEWQGEGSSEADIEAAEIDLTEAIRAGVPAWGQPRPYARKEQIPVGDLDPGRIDRKATPVSVAHQPKVIVSRYGNITILPRQRSADYQGPRWSDIEVDAARLMEARPRPVDEPTSTAALAVEWMLKEAGTLAAAGNKGKRDQMVSDCMNVVGCTKREAEDAHKRLPDHLRRRRGRSPKSPKRSG